MNIPMLITETYGQGNTIKEIRRYSGDSECVERTAPDAWTSPDMDRNVSALSPDRVIIAGAPANTAVRETALGFLERGIEVIIAEDCCAATSKKERKRAMEDLGEAGCRIVSSETIIMELAGGCTKQVMDAVKEIIYS
jgi:nicotinamidase-related amidase